MGVSVWDICLGEVCVHWSSQNACYKYENCCLKEGFCNRSYEPTFSTKHCFSAVKCGRSGFFLYWNDWNSQAQHKHEPFLSLGE